MWTLDTFKQSVYNSRLHAKTQKASLKNKNAMPISILLQKSENLEKSKFSDFIKENIDGKFSAKN